MCGWAYGQDETWDFLLVCLCCLVLYFSGDPVFISTLAMHKFVSRCNMHINHSNSKYWFLLWSVYFENWYGRLHDENYNLLLHDKSELTQVSFSFFFRVTSSNFWLWLIPKQLMTTVNITAQTVTLPTVTPCRPSSQRKRSANQGGWGRFLKVPFKGPD